MNEMWFAKSTDDIAKQLNTNLECGLSSSEIEGIRKKYGYNELTQKKKKSIFIKFLEQFKDFMIIILIIAAIISGIVGVSNGEGITDTIIILIVVIVNAIIGVAQENKAEKSLEALQKLSSYASKVVRNGKIEVIPSKELLPGDILILDTGDFIPADSRIIEAINLKVQESSLTGESVPVNKDSNIILEENIGIGDRTNMLFSSSLITYGRAKAVVVETGMNTEVGKIAGILNDTGDNQTPLQNRLNKLGKILGIVALVICVIIFVVGLLYGKKPLEMFMTAVSLAVAAIPEGLAAVSTIVLAIGVQRMVKRNAIIKKLPAVETLGSSTVICSDKTGTLTQNKMTVCKIFTDDEIMDIDTLDKADTDITLISELERLVHISMLCNDTKVAADNSLTGDPTETALVDMAFKLSFEPSILEKYPRVKEIPFDSDRKLMTVILKDDDKYMVYTKGGIDELSKVCNSYIIDGKIKEDLEIYKNVIREKNEEMAVEALRVLAMAYKELDHLPSDEELKNIEKDMIYVGMVGMIDPPREEARLAVEKCKTAGIKTVMITGDHKTTATAIAKKLGILENDDEAITGIELENMSQEDLEKNIRKYSVYARVSPEHKVRIVKAWQKNGDVVAMTGDGVNDAPALKTADIGCAMGIVGTDVAKEAADVILTDDNFATVVSAVEEGRRIYDNILKAIQFLISSNIGEIIVLFVAILITPWISNVFNIDISLIEVLLPIHILWVNLVTDSLPALALAFDPAETDIMKRKPINSKEGIFSKGMIYRVIYQGMMIGLITLIAFIIGIATPEYELPEIIEYEGKTISIDEIEDIDYVMENGGQIVSKEKVKVEIGQAMAFTTLALSELVHVFNIRNNKKSIFKTGILGNSKLILAIVVAAILMLIILFIPALRHIFGIPILPTQNIIELIALVFSPIVIVEIFKALKINTVKGE